MCRTICVKNIINTVLGPLMDVWLRWNHQPAVIALSFHERLASMKSSACGHYHLFPWTFGFDEIISLRSLLYCFLERLASMKSSACGQYCLFPWTFGFDEIISLRSIFRLVSFPWTFGFDEIISLRSILCFGVGFTSMKYSIYLVYNILFLLQCVSKTISILMSVYGKIYYNLSVHEIIQPTLSTIFYSY